jgi:peroxin-2
MESTESSAGPDASTAPSLDPGAAPLADASGPQGRPWEKEWERATPLLYTFAAKLGERAPVPLRVLRVNQLDASLLDNELTSIIKTSFTKIFSLFRPSLIDRFTPELDAFLYFIMYRLSLYATGSTYGQRLQNLTYRDERQDYLQATQRIIPPSTLQKIMWGVLHIGGAWAWARLNRLASDRTWAERDEDDVYKTLWKVLNYLEVAWKALTLLNFVAFLYNGKYMSPVDRLLGMRLVYARPSVARFVNFEFMNRQLVWHGFSEFLMFLTPLINADRIKRTIYRLFKFRNKLSPSLGNAGCGVCQADPAHSPYLSDCGHLFCYYCIKTAMMVDRSYACPSCNHQIKQIKPFTLGALSASATDDVPSETIS